MAVAEKEKSFHPTAIAYSRRYCMYFFRRIQRQIDHRLQTYHSSTLTYPNNLQSPVNAYHALISDICAIKAQRYAKLPTNFDFCNLLFLQRCRLLVKQRPLNAI